MVINGMYGLGDNIYQRAFIKKLNGPIWLMTPWPEIYQGLTDIHFVRPQTRLRTQRKNIGRQSPDMWVNVPSDPVTKRIRYGNATIFSGSIVSAMGKCFGVAPAEFDLPTFSAPDIGSPYAVIRPVTVRSEWRNKARNPLPEYIAEAADILKRRGMAIVSVADLQAGEEWADQLPPYDIAFHRGELTIPRLLGLIQGADVVVGGVGWIVPACIAYGTPLITILGGQGGHNAPERITGPPMDLTNTRWIYPDNYCRCSKMMHRCNKTISDFGKKFEAAFEGLCRPNR